MSNEFELFDDPALFAGTAVVLLAVLVAGGFWVSRYGNSGMSAHAKDGKIHFRRTGRHV